MAQSTISDASSGCQRLLSVSGDKGKHNDVIVCGSVQSAKQHIIFFGGDVQDYEENMKIHSPKYLKWNLENTALMLKSRFKDSCILVIKPSKMIHRSLSIYKNFLDFNLAGNPEFSRDSGCIRHCSKLYSSAVEISSKCVKDAINGNLDNTSMLDKPVILMAFSKGCVVLNQLVYELKQVKDQEKENQFLSKISAIYWLDSGHNGGSKTWVTDDEALRELAGLGVNINVHVTPYQVNDTGRPWIGKEEAIFVKKLKSLGANIVEHRHFAKELPSLENHFKLLESI